MKINLPKHYITTKLKSELQGDDSFNHLGLKEIPIAYVNCNKMVYNPIVTIEDDFCYKERRIVRPYDSFNTPDVFLFNSDGDIVHKTMKRVGDTYYYEPSNLTEFTPLNFDMYLEVQKQEQYYNDTVYDIKVSAVETERNFSFSNSLLQLFGNNYRKGTCPQNIRFNSGSTNSMTLLENSIYEADFVFIRSVDGSHYGNSIEEVNEIDIQGMLDAHANIWLFCDNYQNRYSLYTELTNEYITLNMNSKILYRANSYAIFRNQALLFDQTIPFEDEDGLYEHEYLNEAVLIVHKKRKGFIVISPAWFLDNLTNVAPIIYEGIMKCYLQSYYKSKTLSSWITDIPVDYQSYSKNKFNRRHNKVTVNDFLGDKQLEDESYRIFDIRTTTPYVRFTGMSNDNEFTFKKIGGPEDPKKKDDEISFYTTKHTVINYHLEDLFKVETPVNLEFAVEDNVLSLIVHPFSSSSKHAYTVEDQTFTVTDLTVSYNLFLGKGSTDLRNLFVLLKNSEQPESSFLKVATITFETKQSPEIYDIRSLGGGLPEDQPNDYDMADIGSILGRPYRVGSSIVIKLPIKLKNFENRIVTELDKHIAAGDEYVIIFESTKNGDD